MGCRDPNNPSFAPDTVDEIGNGNQAIEVRSKPESMPLADPALCYTTPGTISLF